MSRVMVLYPHSFWMFGPHCNSLCQTIHLLGTVPPSSSSSPILDGQHPKGQLWTNKPLLSKYTQAQDPAVKAWIKVRRGYRDTQTEWDKSLPCEADSPQGLSAVLGRGWVMGWGKHWTTCYALFSELQTWFRAVQTYYSVALGEIWWRRDNG